MLPALCPSGTWPIFPSLFVCALSSPHDCLTTNQTTVSSLVSLVLRPSVFLLSSSLSPSRRSFYTSLPLQVCSLPPRDFLAPLTPTLSLRLLQFLIARSRSFGIAASLSLVPSLFPDSLFGYTSLALSTPMSSIRSDSNDKLHFSDSYIPSYIPTLCAPIEARKPGAPIFKKPSILLVVQAHSKISNALREMRII